MVWSRAEGFLQILSFQMGLECQRRPGRGKMAGGEGSSGSADRAR